MTAPNSPRAAFLSPLFIGTFIVLLLAAVGMRPTIAALVANSSKLPIDLRRTLHEFDPYRLASFRLLPDRPGFAEQFTNQDIGTDEWIGKWFQAREPRAGYDRNVMLFVTYYSDPRDSIPHTPEVCYRQGGATVHAIEKVTVETPGLGPDTPRIDARLLRIDDGVRRKAVMYVIVCNGKFFHGRERARLEIGFPGPKHTYFSKVEVVAFCPEDETDFEAAVAECSRLLAEALPVLMDEHFPTHEQLMGE